MWSVWICYFEMDLNLKCLIAMHLNLKCLIELNLNLICLFKDLFGILMWKLSVAFGNIMQSGWLILLWIKCEHCTFLKSEIRWVCSQLAICFVLPCIHRITHRGEKYWVHHEHPFSPRCRYVVSWRSCALPYLSFSLYLSLTRVSCF